MEGKIINQEDKGEYFRNYPVVLSSEKKEIIAVAMDTLRIERDQLEEEKKQAAATYKEKIETVETLLDVLIRTNRNNKRDVGSFVRVQVITKKTGKEVQYISTKTGEVVYTQAIEIGAQLPLTFADEPYPQAIYLNSDLTQTLDPQPEE
jgi:hypothetical protein